MNNMGSNISTEGDMASANGILPTTVTATTATATTATVTTATTATTATATTSRRQTKRFVLYRPNKEGFRVCYEKYNTNEHIEGPLSSMSVDMYNGMSSRGDPPDCVCEISFLDDDEKYEDDYIQNVDDYYGGEIDESISFFITIYMIGPFNDYEDYNYNVTEYSGSYTFDTVHDAINYLKKLDPKTKIWKTFEQSSDIIINPNKGTLPGCFFQKLHNEFLPELELLNKSIIRAYFRKKSDLDKLPYEIVSYIFTYL